MTYMHNCKLHMQQAAMEAVDMGMAMREAAVGVLPAAAAGAVGVRVRREAAVWSFFTCPLFLCVCLSLVFFLSHLLSLSLSLSLRIVFLSLS
jgi:hypothetical protein